MLPDEMRELRAISERLRAVFDEAGYGEVYTPALEYDSEIERADLAGARPAYRLFDEHGNVLVLRSDMTVPIARVVATRYAVGLEEWFTKEISRMPVDRSTALGVMPSGENTKSVCSSRPDSPSTSSGAAARSL